MLAQLWCARGVCDSFFGMTWHGKGCSCVPGATAFHRLPAESKHRAHGFLWLPFQYFHIFDQVPGFFLKLGVVTPPPNPLQGPLWGPPKLCH